LLGLGLLLLSVFAGGLVDHNATLAAIFDHDGLTLAWFVIAYGFIAAVLPVWLLLAPRDYLSTFMKLGTIFLLAIAILLLSPQVKMPAFTQFIDGTGPIFGGKLFPFVFITIACGAISGFHALISSGTTPKLIGNELDIRMIGYGGMLLESFVAIMALIAATILDPGVFFAINSPAGVVGKEAADAVAKISSWGYPVTVEQMQALAQAMGEKTLFARTGGAPSLAVGMASIFGSAFGQHLLAMWYHFAIMFEAVFILTTLDAGTRVGRFMLQDFIGNFSPKFGQTSWYPSIVLSSALIVAAWGYFLYIGVIDPNGGVNILWPLFGISNQMLAAIALSVGTGILIKSGKLKYAWVTGLPLAWLSIVTTVAAYEKIFSSDVRVGFMAAANDLAAKLAAGSLPPEKAAVAPQLIFNQQLDTWLTAFFVIVLWVVIIDMLRVAYRYTHGLPTPPLAEAPAEVSRLATEWATH
jgi:carbon starvation protein